MQALAWSVLVPRLSMSLDLHVSCTDDASMSTPNTLSELRTPAVAAVLDAVRATGKSAFPRADGSPATVVFAVAVLRDLNPVELQQQVLDYADGIALHAMGA